MLKVVNAQKSNYGSVIVYNPTGDRLITMNGGQGETLFKVCNCNKCYLI